VSARFRPLVLCYHAVADGDPRRLEVNRDAMARQLRSVLWRGYRAVRAGDTVAGRGRLVHVTFDDAFRSVRLALPVLERLKMPATVFACSGLADEGRPLDVPELAAEVAADPEAYRTMSWDGLRELVERGLEIGAHTITHAHLPRLSDAELDRELTESKQRIEDELGRPCPFLAYPFGDEDGRVRAAVRRAGYEAAFALQSPHRPFDVYAIPRVDIYRVDSLPRAVLKTSRIHRPLSRLRLSLRRAKRLEKP
jgi:peptidoglycan/xylan/chitin deacetylase (PgdA/CDA1 family)